MSYTLLGLGDAVDDLVVAAKDRFLVDAWPGLKLQIEGDLPEILQSATPYLKQSVVEQLPVISKSVKETVLATLQDAQLQALIGQSKQEMQIGLLLTAVGSAVGAWLLVRRFPSRH